MPVGHNNYDRLKHNALKWRPESAERVAWAQVLFSLLTQARYVPNTDYFGYAKHRKTSRMDPFVLLLRHVIRTKHSVIPCLWRPTFRTCSSQLAGRVPLVQLGAGILGLVQRFHKEPTGYPSVRKRVPRSCDIIRYMQQFHQPE